MERYSVKIDSFEGPLDLLLHLIQQAEVDIYNIPVSDITNHYLEYVRTMQELELNVASEYLVMAATLLEIKSKMLLPQTEEKEEMLLEAEEDDPHAHLMTRLVEYKKYKEAAAYLQEKEKQAALYYAKHSTDVCSGAEQQNEPNLSEEVSLFDLLQAYQSLQNRQSRSAVRTVTTIEAEELSIEERMDDILSSLESNGTVEFSALFPVKQRAYQIVTFLAILELMKDGKVTCLQSENFGDITVTTRGGRPKG
ncbi:segregation and condensation protein A [Bacillus piscicola]|uniref:segregation and condensation protein A n=1 Tax=Bacillus piscicola TaxID=1632684 RepID=UPI001F08B317|nr:segregation/condensation protein A [Bacillus piscicola]